MIERLLSRVLSAADSPTADLYFTNACGDFLGPDEDSGVARLAPTVFASPDACLVMRHDLRAQRLRCRRRLIYLVDDAVDLGVADHGLPLRYRLKLRMVECASAQRLIRRAAIVVVTSDELARRFTPDVEIRQISPYWSEPIAGLEHFRQIEGVEGDSGWFEIAYLGSSVHRADLEFLWPVIADVLRAHPRVRFHLATRHRVPMALAGHPRIVRLAGRGWRDYRAGIRQRRFHMALYPLLDTPFNRARSLNKLIEHAVVGAAPVYSRSWGEAWRAGQCGAGLVLSNDQPAWRAAIEYLLGSPGAARELAGAAGVLAQRLNRPEPQRRLWAELLGLDTRPARDETLDAA